jgi:hypothetical protein
VTKSVASGHELGNVLATSQLFSAKHLPSQRPSVANRTDWASPRRAFTVPFGGKVRNYATAQNSKHGVSPLVRALLMKFINHASIYVKDDLQRFVESADEKCSQKFPMSHILYCSIALR